MIKILKNKEKRMITYRDRGYIHKEKKNDPQSDSSRAVKSLQDSMDKHWKKQSPSRRRERMPMSFNVRIGKAPTVFACHSRTSAARFLNMS